MAELNDLTDLERRAFICAHVYSRERQKRQKFYKPWPDGTEIKDHPVFKSCVTVTKWLEDQGLKITFREPTWEAYIQFVFQKLDPTIPQPGQLKNPLILKEYLKSSPILEVEISSDEKLDLLYKKYLRPEVLENDLLMDVLGLRRKRKPEDE